MNVDLITLPHATALEKYEEYRQSVLEARASETREIDSGLAAGYKALSEGKPLLDLQDVMRRAGLGPDLRPKLAIIRANAQECYFNPSGWDHRGHVPTGPRFQTRRNIAHHEVRNFVELPRGIFGENTMLSGKAIVPLIPPRHRPKRALHLYHILWEADWEDAPIDPYLLRHCAGSLYVVLAEWDLTELERSALRGRLS